MTRTYRRTNAPNTCLWCGKALKPNYGTNVHALPEEEFKAMWNQHPRATKFRGQKVTGYDSMRRAVLTRGAIEDYGTVPGLFHSGRCAQAFGRAAALNGYRFKPEQE